MMDYEMFKALAERKLSDYLPEEYKAAEVTVKTISKVNQKKEVLNIMEADAPSGTVSPNLYLDEMYRKYEECGDLEKVFREAADFYVENAHIKTPEVIRNITPEFVKENLVMAMVNTESNHELLKDIPHREINDCSVIYRLVFDLNKRGMTSTIFDNSFAEKMGLSEQELFVMATENTKRMLPTVVKPMSEVIMEMVTVDGMPKEVAEMMIGELKPEDEKMWIITNDYGLNGAVNMLYEDNLHKLAGELNDDLYILPSSVHEVICVPASTATPEDLAQMVLEINMNQVALEERLSNQVYHYDKDLRKLTMATDTPNKRIDGMVAEQALIYEAKEQQR